MDKENRAAEKEKFTSLWSHCVCSIIAVNRLPWKSMSMYKFTKGSFFRANIYNNFQYQILQTVICNHKIPRDPNQSLLDVLPRMHLYARRQIAWRQNTLKNYAILLSWPCAVPQYGWLFQIAVDLHCQLGRPTPNLSIARFRQLDLRLGTVYPSPLDNRHRYLFVFFNSVKCL